MTLRRVSGGRDGCTVIDEKTWGNHDWQSRMDGSEVCTKCGARRLAAPSRAGRIE
jgi:hypothetical protein